ncbi:SH3 domain-containing protein [Novosphingobium sp. 9]|uniref:SH3 domain-containing protein n=1 Tax=Novosphingobium sp. 9 TaxID=2025349 RepID=UPI0021B61B84|nr:SH3 domain-containing protein [Novosphingobium sp. 9]
MIRSIFSKTILVGLALVAAAGTGAAHAADDGKVPYWATISADKAFLRVGPGNTFRISWVYRRVGLPVKVIRREGPWRLIEDPSGTQGWMRDLLLSRKRGAIVIGDGLAEMRTGEGGAGGLAWKVEPGVTGMLGDCKQGWCSFDAGGHKGFAPEDRLWGTVAP